MQVWGINIGSSKNSGCIFLPSNFVVTNSIRSCTRFFRTALQSIPFSSLEKMVDLPSESTVTCHYFFALDVLRWVLNQNETMSFACLKNSEPNIQLNQNASFTSREKTHGFCGPKLPPKPDPMMFGLSNPNYSTAPENGWKWVNWNTILSFWDGLLSGAFAVSFREDILINIDGHWWNRFVTIL